ncbi:MAG TPA: lipoprotein LpqH [Mycobacterium sp.]|uniref:lipoprotein LpqH n=1 Tax=Mycobacterium sp. TaxID=1785 RepID=UPI002D6D1DDD|nr:lipoprotein LpqH [Mycobacterium sp.]HZU49794.1 lipoprotein LpqH [Mycobacterium sp.]
MDPEPPTEQSPTTPAAEPDPASQQPPTLRPWEVPFPQAATPQEGGPLWPPAGVGSPPEQRSHIGLVIGLIIVVLVAGVVGAGIVGYLLLRDSVTAAIKAPTSTTRRIPGTSTAAAPPATVIVDGQALPIRSSAICAKAGGEMSISVDASQGIAVRLSNTNPLQVKFVSLGTVNGLVLLYNPGVGQNNAVVTQHGNTFDISGTAAGVDTSNGSRVEKPFQINVTCPHL